MKTLLENKIARWIYFAPAFLICYMIAIGLGTFFLTIIYDMTFPINGFWDFLFAGLGISLIMGSPFYFGAILIMLMKMCPNYKLGARVLFFIITPLVVYSYVTKNYDFSLTKIKMQTMLDVITIGCLLLMSFNDFSKEDK
jgi:hypothetical protein